MHSVFALDEQRPEGRTINDRRLTNLVEGYRLFEPNNYMQYLIIIIIYIHIYYTQYIHIYYIYARDKLFSYIRISQ